MNAGSAIAQNMIAFAKSMPTNIVILVIICAIMCLCGKKLKDCVKLIVIYLLAGVLLGIFGIRVPNFLEIADYVKKLFADLW